MTLHILRDDALAVDGDRFEVRISLPWIRSLPCTSLQQVEVTIDGAPAQVVARVGDGWWFLQDRVVLVGEGALSNEPHDVDVSLGLVIPYLAAGPDAPLTLPFRERRALRPGTSVRSVSRDVA